MDQEQSEDVEPEEEEQADDEEMSESEGPSGDDESLDEDDQGNDEDEPEGDQQEGSAQSVEEGRPVVEFISVGEGGQEEEDMIDDAILEYIDPLLEFTTHSIIHLPGDRSTSSPLTQGNTQETSPFPYRPNFRREILQNVPSDTNYDAEFDDRPAKPRRHTVFAEPFNPSDDDDDDDDYVNENPMEDEEKARLKGKIIGIILFKNLTEEQLDQVLNAMTLKEVEPGEIIIQQGDDGDYFYVVDTGIYNIYIDEDNGEKRLVSKLDNSGSFGELSLMYNQPRAATIEATTPGTLYALDRTTFRKIVLKSAYKKRKQYEQFLESVELLDSLQHEERYNLCDALEPMEFTDETIISQGDIADGMYFIEAGQVVIKQKEKGSDEEVEICTLGKSDYFGELALITKEPRAASAYAVGKVKVAFLDIGAFERLLGSCMDVLTRHIQEYETRKKNIENKGTGI